MNSAIAAHRVGSITTDSSRKWKSKIARSQVIRAECPSTLRIAANNSREIKAPVSSRALCLFD